MRWSRILPGAVVFVGFILGLAGGIDPLPVEASASDPSAGPIKSPLTQQIFTVNVTQDVTDGVCNSHCSLRDAVRAANASSGADTIIIPAGVYQLALENILPLDEDDALTGDLDIRDSLTITGMGVGVTILDGGGIDRIFHVLDDETLTISGISFQNGSQTNGGAISSGTAAEMNISDSAFTGNQATNGGAIYAGTASTVHISNCAFTNNHASYGGAIYNSLHGWTIIEDSLFTDNDASGYGGAIYNSQARVNTPIYAGVDIYRSTLENNQALLGGAIYNYGSYYEYGGIRVYQSALLNNYAVNDGGALTGNGYSESQLYNTTVSGNSAARGGAFAVFAYADIVAVFSTVVHNEARTGQGGGVYDADWNPGLHVHETILAYNEGGNCYFQKSMDDMGYSYFSIIDDTTCKPDAYPDAPSQIGVDPRIGPLADHGGPTLTYAPLGGSPAVNVIASDRCTQSADQRDVARPQGALCDIGAVEETVPDVGISKTASTTMPALGEAFTFTLTVTNQGPYDVTGIDVIDNLPSGLTFVSAEPSQGSYNDGTGLWTVGTLPENTSATLLIDATAATIGTITNTATITAAQPDRDPANNTAALDVHVDGTDLGIAKGVDKRTVNEGDTVTYTLMVLNNGPHTAHDVQVTDHLPAGITYLSDDSASSGTTYTNGLWTLDQLDAAQSATLHITGQVDGGTLGQSLVNTATVTITSGQPDPVSSNNQSAPTAVNVGADVGVTLEIDTAIPRLGDVIRLMVTATNYGPGTATNVHILSLLPDELIYLWPSKPTGTEYDPATGDWLINTLPSGSSSSLAIFAEIDPDLTVLDFWTTASITSSDYADPDLSNNTASLLIPLAYADLVVTKDYSAATLNEGDDVQFVVSVENRGTIPALEVTVQDDWPTGLELVGVSPSRGSYDPASGLWTVGDMAVNESASLVMNATIAAETGGTALVNRVTASSPTAPDPDTSNNTASATINVWPPFTCSSLRAESVGFQDYVSINLVNGNNQETRLTRTVIAWDKSRFPQYPGMALTSQALADRVFWNGPDVTPPTDTADPGDGTWVPGEMATISGKKTTSWRGYFSGAPLPLNVYLSPQDFAGTVFYFDNPESDTDCAVPLTVPAQSNLYIVTTTADEIIGGCTAAHCSLREAVISANGYGGNPVIRVPPGTYRLTLTGAAEDNALTGDLDLRTPMTIVGAGPGVTIIDGNRTDRVFDVRSTVTLAGMTIQNGRATHGGGIYNPNNHLTIYNSEIANNEAYSSAYSYYYLAGGGILNDHADLTVVNSTIHHNFETDPYSSEGSGIASLESWVSIVDSTISYNTSSSAVASVRTVTNPNYQHHLEIRGSTFSDNIVAIYNNKNDLTIENSTISHNGYGIRQTNNASGFLQLTNSTIAYNTNAGIYRTETTSTPSYYLANSIVFGNAPDCGGSTSTGPTLTLQGYVLIGNLGTCKISADIDTLLTGIDPLLGPLADNDGPTQSHALLPGSPAIDFIPSYACLTGVDQQGVARPQGIGCDMGAYEVEGPANYPMIFRVNTQADTGDGRLSEGEATLADISQFMITFSEPPADPSGSSAPNDVTNPANYQLIAAGADGVLQTAQCGAVLGDDSAVTVNSVTYLAQYYQASVTINNSSPLSAGHYRLLVCHTITDGTGHPLDGNADGVGGDDFALNFSIAAPSPVLIVDSTTDAVDSSPGDGVCAAAGNVCTLRAAIMEANAQPGPNTILVPAGLYVLTIAGPDEDAAATGDLDIRDAVSIVGDGTAATIIDGNHLDRVFDIRGDFPVEIRKVTLQHGSANGGGAMYSEYATLTLDRCALLDNTAGGGGALYLTDAGTVTITHTTISGNQATASGGGVLISNPDLQTFGIQPDVHLSQSTLLNNTATTGGGVNNGRGRLLIENATISSNAASGSGGGVYTDEGGVTRIVQSTIVYNTAVTNGGGVTDRTTGVKTRLFGSIVAYNTTVNYWNGNCGTTSLVSEGYNLSDDATCQYVFLTTGDRWGVNPELLPLADNGGFTLTYAVQPSSPVINRIPASVCLLATDQRGPGYVRPEYPTSTCDIGAFEAQETINDPPVNTVPGAQIDEPGIPLVFSSANGNLIRVDDPDVGTKTLQVMLSVDAGTLTLSSTAGLSFSAGDGTEDGVMTFSGKLADVNAALDGLVFTPPAITDATVTLTITTNDLGNSGSGGAKTDVDSVTLIVTGDNDPPEITMPGPQSTDEDTPLTFAGANAISLSDPDAASSPVLVSLGISDGTLTLSSTTGLTFSDGDGTDDALMTFTGAITDVNTALDGLIFTPAENFNGDSSLTITVDDQGYTGSGGALTATDTVTITVNAINDAPHNTVPGPQFTEPENALIFSTTNDNALRVDDVDAGANPVEVSLAVTHGTLTLNGTAGLTFSEGDGSGDAVVAFAGALIDINAALDGLVYQPAPSYGGPDVLSIDSGDQGYSGAGGPLSDSSTVDITINVPVPPPLVSPPDDTLTSQNQPTLAWEAIPGAAEYHVQVDDSVTFDSPAVDVQVAQTSYTPAAPLADGTVYFWHVQSLGAGQTPGEWGAVWSFAIDKTRSAAPVLQKPKDHTTTKDTTPAFTWKTVRGTVNYQLQLSDDPGFGSPLEDVQTLTAHTYTLPADHALPYGIYYWRVRAQDAGDNWSEWSYTDTLTLTILAAPKNAQHLTDTTPTLKWQSAAYSALYEVEMDAIGEDFSDPVFEYTGTARSVTAPELAGGDYQWRARADTGTGWSAWTPAWTFTITPPTTTAPVLFYPANGAALDTTTPGFGWAAVTNGVTYQIQISANSSFKTPVQDVTLTPGARSYLAEPLANGGRYYWRVRAINSLGVAGAWSAKWRFTLNQLAVPILAGPVTGTQSTDTTPDLTWNPVTDAVSYEILIDADKRFGSPEQILTTAATATTANPLPDGKYFWRVRAVNAFGVTGLWSGKWNFTVDTTGPDQPVLRSPADHAGTRDSTPTLVWKSAKTAKQYHVQVADDVDFTPVEAEHTVGTTTSYTIPAAEALDYGVHYWRVQAGDALGNWGEWSTPFQFALTNMLSPKDGATTTSARPTFAWAAVTGASAYHFELADNPDFIGPVETFSGPNRSFQPPAPLAAGPYYWHVSVDGGDWMPTWTLVITPAKPARPKLSSPANKAVFNDSTPTFDWLAALDGQTYQIQIDDNGDFSGPEQDVTVGVGLYTYIAGELADGKYYWRVRAFNTDGAPGAWSAKWYFTLDTVAPPVPDLLAPIDGAASTNRKLKLSWTKVDGASAYDLQLDPDPAFPLPVISTGNKTTYTPPTPLSRGVYWWQVRALDKAGNASDWSAPRSFEIVAGITAPTVEAPTPLATEPTAPIVEPTQPPEPTVEPTQLPGPTVEPPAPPDSPLPMVTPPVSETFDSKADWQAKGLWKFGKNAGMEGGGWFADSTRRGALSLLTAPVLIDLSGAQTPSLRFWQRVGLSSGDLAAVDVSTDGGQTWQPLDQQRGHLAEWSERAVDLSAYHGQIVRLRFRLDTPGTVPKGETTVGWWIDDLTVQDVTVIPPTATPIPTEEATMTPLPTEVPTETPVPTAAPTETPVPTQEPTATAEPPVEPTQDSTAVPNND